MDEKFLHPLFEMADIFIKKGDAANSLRVINWLKEANKKATIPRDNEIKQLEKNFSSGEFKLKNQTEFTFQETKENQGVVYGHAVKNNF